jgi:hypothetical protein
LFCGRAIRAQKEAWKESREKNSELVAHFFLFGLEVSSVVRICSGSDRELLHDFDIVGLEAYDFAGVVGEESDIVDAKIS